jgi:hypothetical protein
MAISTLSPTSIAAVAQVGSKSGRSHIAAAVVLPAFVMVSALVLIRARAETSVFVEHWRPTVTHTQLPVLQVHAPPAASVSASAPQPTHTSIAPTSEVVESERPSVSVSHAIVDSVDRESIAEDMTYWEGSSDWAWDESAWRAAWQSRMERWRAAWMQRRWAAIAPAVARLQVLRSAMIESWMSSNLPLGIDSSMLENASSCGVFSCVWQPQNNRSRASVASPPSQLVAVRRLGPVWQLVGTDVLLSIRDGAACAVSVARTNRPTETVVLSTPTAAGAALTACSVSESTTQGQASLIVQWRGDDWTQVADISLANATQPQVYITRTRQLTDGSSQIELTNLSPTHHTWIFGGREIEAAPGDVVQLRSTQVAH